MLIRLDDQQNGVVTLNGEIIPGVLQSIAVNGAIIYEKSGAEKSQAKKKVLSGYDDKTVSIVLLLIGESENEETDYDDIYEQMAAIENMFMNTKNKLPVVYTMNHPMIKARNIDKVLFKSFDSDWSTGGKKASANLEFVEFVPAKYEVVDKEAADAKTSEERAKGKYEKTFFDEGRETATSVLTGKK